MPDRQDPENRDEIVVPVLEEQLHVDTVAVPAGGVRVIKRVVENNVPIDELLRVQKAEVERRPIGEYVDGPQPIRDGGDTVIVPVVEEQLVIERRWFLKEELHIRRTEATVHHHETVSVRREEVTVERMQSPPLQRP